MSEDERQTYVDVDCWQLEDGRTFVGNRAVEYVPLAEVERLREENGHLWEALNRAGRALNRAGWNDESQAALDVVRRAMGSNRG